MSPLLSLVALSGLGLAACQAAPTAQGEGARDAVTTVVLRGDGEDLTLTRTATGCDAGGTAIHVRDGEAHGGGWHLTPAPAATLSLSHGPDLVVRLVDAPGPPLRRAYLDPVGVPLARATVGADQVAVVGPDRAPLGTLDADLRWHRAGHPIATVTGTTDLLLAASLVTPPSLPVAGRAVVACARLAATVPSPAK